MDIERKLRYTEEQILSFNIAGVKMRTFKIVIAGNGSVGKSSLLHRYVAGQFNRSYSVTIGADFASREVDIGNETIRLVIWDLAGQRRFHVVRDGFYRGARAVILVFDTTNRESWEDLTLWEEEVSQRVPTAHMVVVGNKTDLRQKRAIPHEIAHRWARQRRYGYVETSCATGVGVDDLFVGVAHLVTRSSSPTRRANSSSAISWSNLRKRGEGRSNS